jgi:hypothetical protein
MPSVWWIYEVGTTARWGQTVDKMFTGVQVRRTDFTRVGFGRALLRSAVRIALGCVSMFYEVRLVDLIPREIVQGLPYEYIVVFTKHFSPHSNLMLLVWPGCHLGARRACDDALSPQASRRPRPDSRNRRRSDPLCPRAKTNSASPKGGTRDRRLFCRRSAEHARCPAAVPVAVSRWDARGGVHAIGVGRRREARNLLAQRQGSTRAKSFVKDSKPRRREDAWQSFDESGAITKDTKFIGGLF